MALDGTGWSWSTLGDVTAVDGGARWATVSEGAWCNAGSISP